MEKVNLIPAAELPVAETHDVEVICLEEGELKRKPAANLGGGAEPDMVIRFTLNFEEETYDAEILSGTFDEVKQKIIDNKPGIVRMIEDFTNAPLVEGSRGPEKIVMDATVCYMPHFDELGEALIPYDSWSVDFLIRPDGVQVRG